MTVKQWVDFLQNDELTEKIGLQLNGGLKCSSLCYFPKDEISKLLKDWMDEKVVKVWHCNMPGCTLIVFE